MRQGFKKGDVVNYHSIIGCAVTSENHAIESIEYYPNNFGCDVAWISEKSGCVALDALSNEDNEPVAYEPPKKLTRSQKRYAEFKQAVADDWYHETFADYLGIRT